MWEGKGTHLHRNVSLTVVLDFRMKDIFKAETHSTVETVGLLGLRPILSVFFVFMFSVTP